MSHQREHRRHPLHCYDFGNRKIFDGIDCPNSLKKSYHLTMADVHDESTRSFNMSRIRNKDTKPELIVRKFLFSKGFRYKLHDKGLPGKPDIVLPKYRSIIFVHGCFWHGHTGCPYFIEPKTRKDWWLEKINRNRLKDSESSAALVSAGWKVLTVFECELRRARREETLRKLLNDLP
jgi:DNA mismatch endonuclease, patch repair protein